MVVVVGDVCNMNVVVVIFVVVVVVVGNFRNMNVVVVVVMVVGDF